MVYTPIAHDSMPIPVEPAVLAVHIVNSSAETNVPVFIPWDNVKLDYAYTVCTEAVDATGAMEIDLEVNAAGGTEIMTISVAAASAVGDVYEATFSSKSASRALGRNNTARDAINVEIDGSADAAGSVMLYLYFSADNTEA